MTQNEGVRIVTEVSLRVKSDEHEIKLVCDQNCPLGKLWDALAAFQGEILRQIDQNTEKPAAKDGECQEKDSESSQEA